MYQFASSAGKYHWPPERYQDREVKSTIPRAYHAGVDLADAHAQLGHNTGEHARHKEETTERGIAYRLTSSACHDSGRALSLSST